MDDTYDLYGGMPPHQPRDTSIDAAHAIQAQVGRLQRLVLDHLIECGERGATDFELEQALSMAHQTVSARRRELVQKNLVMDSGMRRATEKSKARVWVVAPEGYGGDNEEPGTSGVKTTPASPSPAVIKKALVDIRSMVELAKEHGFEFQYLDESKALGRWLRSLADG